MAYELNVKQTPSKKHSGGNNKKSGVLIHWTVGSLASVDAAFIKGKVSASAHYCVDQNVIHQYYPDHVYGWHAGNTQANRDLIGIEHVGGWEVSKSHARAKKIGGKYRYDPAPKTMERSAQLVAAKFRKYKWNKSAEFPLGKPQVGKNIFGHSMFAATMCPGTIDLKKLRARVTEILYGDSTKTGETRPRLTKGAQGEHVKTLQRAINNLIQQGAIHGMALLKVDGDWWDLTDAGLRALEAWAMIAQDGVLDADTWAAVDAALAYVAGSIQAPDVDEADEPEAVDPVPSDEPEALPPSELPEGEAGGHSEDLDSAPWEGILNALAQISQTLSALLAAVLKAMAR